MRAAVMHASDIPIQRTPCVHPNMSVPGWGLPSAKAQSNSDVYTHECKNDVHFSGVNTHARPFARPRP